MHETFKRVNLTHINEVVISNPHDAIEIDVAVPVDDVILRERIFYAFNADSPEWLRAATKQFLEALVRLAQERPDITEDKCSTCTGVCCTKPWAIRVTEEDVERLRDHYTIEDIEEIVVSYSEEAWTGYVGEMARGEDGACVFFKNGGCSQHEIRPSVCREYSAHKCDLYEYDDKKYHLKIAGQDPFQPTRE